MLSGNLQEHLQLIYSPHLPLDAFLLGKGDVITRVM
jgi:hypothetical protein